MSAKNLQRLGVLTRSFGLQGGIRCALDSMAVPKVRTPCAVRIGFSESFTEERELALCENHSGSLICYFTGVASRDAADALFDRGLWIDPSLLEYDDPFSDARLVGYRVFDEAGRDLGTIVDIIGSHTQYVWIIYTGEREWMMPAVEEFVREIRADDRRVIVRPIPGMYDDDEEEHEQQG